jgi:ectoine hydroxylase
LRGPAYIYQFKVNLKAAFDGDHWPWHQDFSFWKQEDGMPSARAVTAAIFLDDVTEFNGPIFVIPRSQHFGVMQTAPDRRDDPDWRTNFSSALKYQTSRQDVTALASRNGLCSLTGPSGTIVFFHSNVVHASAANISPHPRRIIFITYNSIFNLPQRLSRPEFLVTPYTGPLAALNDDCLQSTRTQTC